ncbi:hypothetical protein HI914_03522 [Erysiphe necator]|nr:hypothetical protein HI914_03522 [Erysiphe necator]
MHQENSNHQQIIISEVDLVGNDIAKYIQSNSEKNHRIDVIISSKVKDPYYVRKVIEAFLPVGFPGSVTSDYLSYQIYVRFYDYSRIQYRRRLTFLGLFTSVF